LLPAPEHFDQHSQPGRELGALLTAFAGRIADVREFL